MLLALVIFACALADIVIETVSKDIAFSSLTREEKYLYFISYEGADPVTEFTLVFPAVDKGRFTSFHVYHDLQYELDVRVVESRVNGFFEVLVALPSLDNGQCVSFAVYLAYDNRLNAPKLEKALPLNLPDFMDLKAPLGTYTAYKTRLQLVRGSTFRAYNQSEEEALMQDTHPPTLVRVYIDDTDYPALYGDEHSIEYLFTFADDKRLHHVDIAEFIYGLALGGTEAYATSWKIVPAGDAQDVVDGKEVPEGPSFSSLYLVLGLKAPDIGLVGEIQRTVTLSRAKNTYRTQEGKASYIIGSVDDSYAVRNPRSGILGDYDRVPENRSVRSTTLLVTILDRYPLAHSAYDELGKIYTTAVRDVRGQIGQTLKFRYPLEGGFKSEFSTRRIQEFECISATDPEWGRSLGLICSVELTPLTLPVVVLEGATTRVRLPSGSTGVFVIFENQKYRLGQDQVVIANSVTSPNCVYTLALEREDGVLRLSSGSPVVSVTVSQCVQRDVSGAMFLVGYKSSVIDLFPLLAPLFSLTFLLLTVSRTLRH